MSAINVSTVENSDNIGLQSYMTSVYRYVGAGIFISAITAFLVSLLDGGIFYSMVDGKLKPTTIGYVGMFAPLALILVMTWMRDNLDVSRTLFWLFTALQGVGLAIFCSRYSTADVSFAFFATSAGFLGLSFYGYITKRDLTWVGTLSVFSLVSLLIVLLASIIFGIALNTVVVGVIGVLIFAGLTAWETQNLRDRYHKDVNNETYAIDGAVGLYLNFLNMFQFILSIVGVRKY